MRFGDGAWRMLEDVTPSYLSRVDGVDITERRAVFHVFSRLEPERWATLQGHMFTLEVTSPAENVFRIRMRHHLGRRERQPRFDVDAEPRPFSHVSRSAVSQSAANQSAVAQGGGAQSDRRVLRSGALELSIDESPWGLHFVDASRGETITTSPYKAQAMMDKASVGTFMREQLTLAFSTEDIHEGVKAFFEKREPVWTGR